LLGGSPIFAFGISWNPVNLRAGERATVEVYVLNAQENDFETYVRIDVLGVFDKEGNPVNPHWFENFTVEPENFFLPNLYKYRIWQYENVPTSIPKEAENFFDRYYWSGDSWFPVKTVRVSFDISREAHMGEYFLKVQPRGTMGGGQISVDLGPEAKIPIRLAGPAPPPKPIPVLLTLIILVIVIAILVVLRPVLRKKRVKI
jgi:hypothetical protein